MFCMIDFDDIAVDVSEDKWEVTLLSFMEDDDAGIPRYSGHELNFVRAIPQTSPDGRHLDAITAQVQTYDELVYAAKLLRRATQLYEPNDLFALEICFLPYAYLIPTEERDPRLVKGMDELQVFEEMMHGGWSYEMVIPPVFAKRIPCNKQLYFYQWNWHGKQLKTPVTFGRNASRNASWDKIALSLADEALKVYEAFPLSIPRHHLIDGWVDDAVRTQEVFGNNPTF